MPISNCFSDGLLLIDFNCTGDQGTSSIYDFWPASLRDEPSHVGSMLSDLKRSHFQPYEELCSQLKVAPAYKLVQKCSSV